MDNYIRDSKRLGTLNNLLKGDDRYKRIRDRCNDNTHYNFYRNVMLNDNEVHIAKRLDYLNTLYGDLRRLIVMHLAYIFHHNPHYMASDDILDYLESHITPPEDCQYWVAPFIQEIFTSLLEKVRPDVAVYIKDNTSMLLN